MKEMNGMRRAILVACLAGVGGAAFCVHGEIAMQPFVVEASGKWLPLSVKRGVMKGGALDFSKISGLDAPAGKHGRVVVRDGHFEFVDKPGEKRRFYGVNLCFGANYFQSPESADLFAEELARRGYNAVRIHHHDGMLVDKAKGSTVIDPVRMRELDALVAAFIRHGLYVTTDLYVSRAVPWQEIGMDRPGTIPIGEFKMLVRENEAAYSNLCTFAENWLTHTNEFTGRRWADELGIAWISLVNENVPDNFRPGLNDAGRAHQIELENRFYSRMTKFLREEVGAKQLFTDLNGWSTSRLWSPCRMAFDYVDMHFYVDHPRFLERSWQLPSACANIVPFADDAPHGVSWARQCRIPGKPFTITEWNFSAPGNYRGVGGIATGAWAAREDWDGLWRFAWSHSVEGVKNPCGQAMGYFDMSGDPLSLAGERASMCLFLRGDLAAGDASALVIDGTNGTMSLNTSRTAGGFATSGKVSAGSLMADIGPESATIWASSLDGEPLPRSKRILLTHLTDVQNTGARFSDRSMKTLLDWGRLPHLMRCGRADVALELDEGAFAVYVLETDGSRRDEIPSAYRDGKLTFVADVARDPGSASYLYEIVRRSDAKAPAPVPPPTEAVDRISKRVNQDFKVTYPDFVSQRPVLRGVMLPGRPCKEKDLADLAAWGATLARYQMCVTGEGAAYDRDLDVWLTRLETDILGWARKHGILLVVDLHTPPGNRYRENDVDPGGHGRPNDFKMLYEERYARKFIEVWRLIAKRLKGNEDVIYGYDLCNEPVQRGSPVGIDSLELQRLAAEAVRRIDPLTPIVVEADDWDNPESFAWLSPLRMDNVIYEFHMYRPHELTHQRVGGDKGSTRPILPYPCKERGWDKEFLRQRLQNVVAFQRRHSARILVGEFSCIAWTPGADRYIADVIDLFEEYGWDWSYHAFREWPGWSVEHEWADPKGKPMPSADNPRLRALRDGLRR